MRRPRRTAALITGVSLVLLLPGVAAAAPTGTDTRVTAGSPATPFPQNKQNEPAVAMDAHQPTVLAAGSNDEIDLAPCKDKACPFTPGIGVSGIYFSLNGGGSWVQPTYTGLTARDGDVHGGLIGTLPWYYESGLVSGGDPALAFGPLRGTDGRFSWSNGSRLYYATLASNLTSGAFRGAEAVAVSRTDDVPAAAAGDKNAWQRPVIVSRQSSALFSDKEQIWADNAASSRFFGNVYTCNVAFRGKGKGNATPEPVLVARSTDGGDTWVQHQISAATNNNQTGGRQGCSVRTDSRGVVYVFFLGSDVRTRGNVHLLARSFDGSRTFTRPTVVQRIEAPGVLDPVGGRGTLDGYAGARADLTAGPSVDIANGAPTGAGAPDTILDTWTNGVGAESRAVLSASTDRGISWSARQDVTDGADRALFSAVAIEPHGGAFYLVYDALLTPFQSTTAAPRLMQGVVRAGSLSGGRPSGVTTLHRGAVGDLRGSSTNSLTNEFIGDYNYAVASDAFGVAVWNDVRDAADCPAIDAYRQSLVDTALSTGTTVGDAAEDDGSFPRVALGDRPAPLDDCPPAFGNTEIYGGQFSAR